MNKDLIEKLKDNKVAWLFLTKEEQACMKQVNTTGNMQNLKYCGEWESSGVWGGLGNGATEIWRIKPDYEPEPECVDIEIVADGLFWVLKETIPGTNYHVNMADAALRRTFVYYMSDDHRSTRVVGLATQWASEGKKVIARFVRE